ncbi:hypothetical protein DPMN_039744 [Dreissena polymorpha]|uniref:Uncharacterized protein n=1 Tax=Dreissena polymorpha TaxID=45954 RepID=A0A9D4CTS7_DREPO|nr:hypothetical protein DPMN_039744 [Dreissena polymorpha]
MEFRCVGIKPRGPSEQHTVRAPTSLCNSRPASATPDQPTSQCNSRPACATPDQPVQLQTSLCSLLRSYAILCNVTQGFLHNSRNVLEQFRRFASNNEEPAEFKYIIDCSALCRQTAVDILTTGHWQRSKDCSNNEDFTQDLLNKGKHKTYHAMGTTNFE